MRNLDRRRRRWVRVRVSVLGAAVLIGAALVGRRAWELQLERGASLEQMAEAQYLHDIELAPKRGTIYDRHGAELAVSVDIDSVWANPKAIRRAGREPRRVAAELADVLSPDAARIAKRLEDDDRQFVWVERHIKPEQAAAVRKLDLPGVRLMKEPRRYYPNRKLAAHVLGFANIDGKGIEGLELAYEDPLRGPEREVPAIRDRRGKIVFSEHLVDDASTQGHDLVLTIDKTIQHIAEQELALGIRTFEAAAGSVVVMDPRSGELLAIANYPTYNPNDAGDFPPAHRRNRAVTDQFEPGSTVKPFTVAAALGKGAVDPEQMIDCENGSMEVADSAIHDSHRFGKLTPAEILKYSSNIGTAKIGRSMGRRGLYGAMRRFGFGSETKVRLPGEASGVLRHYRDWYEMDATTIAFGQGMSTTTVQLATAMSAVANGGKLMRPILVKRVTDSRGRAVERHVPRVRRRAVPQWSARLVGDMLTGVTGPEGTGSEAAIDGYLVAGKTGTAQKADPRHGGYFEDKWLASFVGFVPADDPRLSIAVVIDEPVIAHYGGAVAGPVFRRIGKAALRHLGIPGDEGGNVLARNADARNRAKDEEEASAGGAAARSEARKGQTDTGARAHAATTPDPAETRVPDLGGRTARAALRALREADLMPALEGSGVVVSQTPAPQTVVDRGVRVHVRLAKPRLAARGAPDPSREATP